MNPGSQVRALACLPEHQTTPLARANHIGPKTSVKDWRVLRPKIALLPFDHAVLGPLIRCFGSRVFPATKKCAGGLPKRAPDSAVLWGSSQYNSIRRNQLAGGRGVSKKNRSISREASGPCGSVCEPSGQPPDQACPSPSMAQCSTWGTPLASTITVRV